MIKFPRWLTVRKFGNTRTITLSRNMWSLGRSLGLSTTIPWLLYWPLARSQAWLPRHLDLKLLEVETPKPLHLQSFVYGLLIKTPAYVWLIPPTPGFICCCLICRFEWLFSTLSTVSTSFPKFLYHVTVTTNLISSLKLHSNLLYFSASSATRTTTLFDNSTNFFWYFVTVDIYTSFKNKGSNTH